MISILLFVLTLVLVVWGKPWGWSLTLILALSSLLTSRHLKAGGTWRGINRKYRFIPCALGIASWLLFFFTR